jgi:hypothetical protein
MSDIHRASVDGSPRALQSLQWTVIDDPCEERMAGLASQWRRSETWI